MYDKRKQGFPNNKLFFLKKNYLGEKNKFVVHI